MTTNYLFLREKKVVQKYLSNIYSIFDNLWAISETKYFLEKVKKYEILGKNQSNCYKLNEKRNTVSNNS